MSDSLSATQSTRLIVWAVGEISGEDRRTLTNSTSFDIRIVATLPMRGESTARTPEVPNIIVVGTSAPGVRLAIRHACRIALLYPTVFMVLRVVLTKATLRRLAEAQGAWPKNLHPSFINLESLAPYLSISQIRQASATANLLSAVPPSMQRSQRTLFRALIFYSVQSASVANFAADMNLSPRLLQLRLKRAGAPTPKRILQLAALAHAAWWHSRERWPAKRIAARLGYRRRQTLSSAFTRVLSKEMRGAGTYSAYSVLESRLKALLNNPGIGGRAQST